LNGRITPRLKEIEAIMRHAGRVTLTENIWGMKWTKLINSTMMLGTLGVLGLNACEATRPGVVDLLIKVGREGAAVGRALGYTTEAIFGMPAEAFSGATDEVLKKNIAAIVGFIGKKARGVVLQDFIKKRASEAPYFNGLIAEKGRAAGVPTPYNDAVMQLVARIGRGECMPVPENLNLLQQLAAPDRA
jgi:2-dehydropantoate 2-reductase